MKVKYKEDPGAWCQSTLFTVIGLGLLSCLLRWRHVLNNAEWLIGLGLLALVANLSLVRPTWFRGYYRFSTWAGFWSSQWVARALLTVIFLVIIVPAGIVVRLFGKDPLRVRRSSDAASYWIPAKQSSPLDRLF